MKPMNQLSVKNKTAQLQMSKNTMLKGLLKFEGSSDRLNRLYR